MTMMMTTKIYNHFYNMIREGKEILNQSQQIKKRKKLSVKSHPILWRNDDGTIRNATCKESNWYTLCIETPPTND